MDYAGSRGFTFQKRQSAAQSQQRLMGLARLLDSGRSGLEVGSRLTTTFGSWLAQEGTDKTLPLQPFQRRIHTGKRHLATALFSNITRNKDAISIPRRPHDGEENHELQLPQVFALPHNFYNSEVITGLQMRADRPSPASIESAWNDLTVNQ